VGLPSNRLRQRLLNEPGMVFLLKKVINSGSQDVGIQRGMGANGAILYAHNGRGVLVKGVAVVGM